MSLPAYSFTVGAVSDRFGSFAVSCHCHLRDDKLVLFFLKAGFLTLTQYRQFDGGATDYLTFRDSKHRMFSPQTKPREIFSKFLIIEKIHLEDNDKC